MTIPELLGRQVAATPDAVAVVCGPVELTYAELGARAEALAAELVARGVGPESLVGLALPRSAELVVALLGVWKSGAAYLPIDPGYPSQRQAFLLADAAPDLVLTGLEPFESTVDTPAPRRVRPDNLAYVMYTSGSTGTPKGVEISHDTVVNGVTQLATIVGMRPGARMLAAASVNFDVSVFEIVAALSTGATLEVVRDILELGERGGWRGSVLHSVPSVFAEVLAAAGDRITVDTAVFAGEALPTALVRQVRRRNPGASVVNAYGQTESFYATTFTVPDDWAGTTVPIGSPLSNQRTYVLGPGLGPVPSGMVGELYVGGAIARGYHGKPALTAERFVADPYGPPGSRMYRTGDLARTNPDGHLEFAGRTDTQLKIHGQRIEPAEIEQILITHPGIAHAVVVPWRAGNQLVAYLVPAGPGADLNPRRLRRFVADRLPAYMIPGRFVVLDRLPLAANGKLDLAGLPEPRAGREH